MNYLFTSDSENETFGLGIKIGELLSGGEFIALSGELGAGKTYFTKGIVKGLGANPEEVVSPTFTLINEYPGKLKIYHADFYRIVSSSDVESTGIWEHLDDESGVVIVEWADKFKDILPEDRLDVQIVSLSEEKREIIISAFDDKHSEIIKKIIDASKNIK